MTLWWPGGADCQMSRPDNGHMSILIIWVALFVQEGTAKSVNIFIVSSHLVGWEVAILAASGDLDILNEYAFRSASYVTTRRTRTVAVRFSRIGSWPWSSHPCSFDNHRLWTIRGIRWGQPIFVNAAIE
jgi:hypothetical protein